MERLYIIGNGFDLYHGAKSNYADFRRYMLRRAPDVVSAFDLYFGPKSLANSFEERYGFILCMMPEIVRRSNAIPYPKTTWAEKYLWSDFERYLSELNREKVFDILDMYLPEKAEEDEGFRYSDYYLPLDNISEKVRSCTFEMKYLLHKWVNTLHYEKGFRGRLLPLDRDALYLTFNYTLFLESEYAIPEKQILHIHGSRKDPYGSLIIGHNADDEANYRKWVHNMRNRRRYRPNLKDRRGHYFANDKLAYLTFFLEDEEKGNWRLPTRYYAAMEAEDRLERYYSDNYKNTAAIIRMHSDFFNSLSSIREIIVIGHSLSNVDMPYLIKAVESVDMKNVNWKFSWHSDKDVKNIENFCRQVKIPTGKWTKFAI